MTIALEHIQPDDWAAVNRIGRHAALVVIDTGGVSLGIRGGVSTVTWPGGSTFSTAKSITHGLGRTPTRVLHHDASGGTLAHIPRVRRDRSARPRCQRHRRNRRPEFTGCGRRPQLLLGQAIG
jgi:hypothetical protein